MPDCWTEDHTGEHAQGSEAGQPTGPGAARRRASPYSNNLDQRHRGPGTGRRRRHRLGRASVAVAGCVRCTPWRHRRRRQQGGDRGSRQRPGHRRGVPGLPVPGVPAVRDGGDAHAQPARRRREDPIGVAHRLASWTANPRPPATRPGPPTQPPAPPTPASSRRTAKRSSPTSPPRADRDSATTN